MANQQYLDIIFNGVRNWNKWRETNSDEWPDFSGANLEKLDLTGINLQRTFIEDLSGGFYIGANLININFTNANLTKADLTPVSWSLFKYYRSGRINTCFNGCQPFVKKLSGAYSSVQQYQAKIHRPMPAHTDVSY